MDNWTKGIQPIGRTLEAGDVKRKLAPMASRQVGYLDEELGRRVALVMALIGSCQVAGRPRDAEMIY